MLITVYVNVPENFPLFKSSNRNQIHIFLRSWLLCFENTVGFIWGFMVLTLGYYFLVPAKEQGAVSSKLIFTYLLFTYLCSSLYNPLTMEDLVFLGSLDFKKSLKL